MFTLSKEYQLKRRTNTYYKALEMFNKNGYTLLTSQEDFIEMSHRDGTNKIDFICPQGHRHNILWSNFRNGQRCGKCLPHISGVSWGDVIDLFEKNKGWKILSKESEWKRPNTDKVTCQCEQGHIHQYTYSQLKSKDYNCPHCSNMVPITFSEIRESMESEGYTVHTKEEEFETQSITKIYFTCPNGHNHYIRGRKWRMGRRCSKCSVSKEEVQVRQFLDEQNIPYETNNREVVKNPTTGYHLELDFWFPDKYKAIELNGVYWHSRPDKQNNDIIKLSEAQKMRLPILIVTDYDWNNNREETEKRILEFLK